MTQKAKKVPTSTDRLRESLVNNRQLHALNRINRTPATIGSALLSNFGGSAGGVQSASGNFLKTQGDTMVGPIAYFPATVAINGSDELDITPTISGSVSKASSYVIASFASPDKIQLIIGAQFAGQLLYLQVPAASVLTIEDYSNNAGGNIVTSDGNDIVITTTTDPVTFSLLFDVTLGPNGNNGGWVVLNAKSITGGSATASFPLNYPVDDQGNKSGTVTHSLTATTAHKLQFTATGDCDITITGFGSSNANAVDFYIEVTQDGTGGHAITVNDAEWIDFPTLSTSLDTTSLIACHADGDGNMRAITLLNAAASSSGNFASKQLDNLSATSLNADIHMNANSMDEFTDIVSNATNPAASGSSNVIRIGNQERIAWRDAGNTADIYIKSTASDNIEINGSFLPEADGTRSLGLDLTRWSTAFTDAVEVTNSLTVGGTALLQGDTSLGDNDADIITFRGEIDINDIAAPAAPAAGKVTLYVDSADGITKVIKSDSSVVSLEAAATQTPWAQNIDAASFVLDNVSRINQDGTVPTSGFINMANSAGLSWEASPAGTDGVLTYSASEHFTFTSSVGGAVIGANGQSLGLTGSRWGTVWQNAAEITSTLVVGGNTILGDANTDTLSVNADIATDLNPDAANTRDVGGSAAAEHWRHAYFDGTITTDKLAADDGAAISILHDLDFTSGKYPNLVNTSVSASGTTVELPLNGSSNAAAEGYVQIQVNGVVKKIAFWS